MNAAADTPELRAEEFETFRPRLFGIAYRMTGSVGDAEDACQDAWLRWQRVDRATVENAEAYLVRVVTRLALDRLQSAQHRRETYVGPYLPEPLVADTAAQPDVAAQPEAAAELADSLTFAFLVLLDELTPKERAVLLLHDVFGYSFDEIGRMVDLSPAACRQLASRTRRKLDHERDALRRPDEAREQELITQLLTTIASGDVDAVMELLAPDVVLLSDGGAERHAARRPVVGTYRVARLVVNLAKRLMQTDVTRLVQVNGEPGLLFVADGEPDHVLSIAFTPDGKVRRFYSQLNPEKLRHLH
jgi:RNA polymerase sigma-70 factor (ECF subfamily)